MDSISNRILLGIYNIRYNELLGIKLPEVEIWQYPGFEKHVAKKHSRCLCYINKVKEIIETPDYISVNNNIPNSIEFIKMYTEILLLSVNLDLKNNYLFVSSLYEIEAAKLERKKHSGNCKRIFDI